MLVELGALRGTGKDAYLQLWGDHAYSGDEVGEAGRKPVMELGTLWLGHLPQAPSSKT